MSVTCSICGKKLEMPEGCCRQCSPYYASFEYEWMGGCGGTHMRYCPKCEANRCWLIDAIMKIPNDHVDKLVEYYRNNIR